jgi:hypothetical protein
MICANGHKTYPEDGEGCPRCTYEYTDLKAQLAAAEKRAETLREALEIIASGDKFGYGAGAQYCARDALAAAKKRAENARLRGCAFTNEAPKTSEEAPRLVVDAERDQAQSSQRDHSEDAGTSPAPDSGDAERAAREWVDWLYENETPCAASAKSLAALLRERDRATWARACEMLQGMGHGFLGDRRGFLSTVATWLAERGPK